MKSIGEPLRVLHVIPTLALGGAETYLRRLARAELGSRVAPAVCAMHRGGPVEALLRADGVPTDVIGIQRASIRRPWRALRDARALRRAALDCARRHRAQLIQTHLSDADWLGLAVGAALRVPVVLTFHSSKLLPAAREPNEFRGWLRRVLQGRMVRRADALIAVGSDVRASLLQFRGVDPDQVHVIPSGIELPGPEHAADAVPLRAQLLAGALGPLFVAVGRLVPSKGVDLLLRAFARIHAAEPGARLALAGDGPERAALHALARELGVEGAVHWLGATLEVRPLHAAADLYLTATRREGLGLAAAEALAAGRMVVGFRVSGIEDVVEDGRTGALVPDGDEAALAAAALRLARDPARRAAAAPACRSAAARFDVQRARALTEELYFSLVGA